MANLNRIKLVLVEQNKTGKWLADALGKNSKHGKQMVSKYYSARPEYS